MLLANKVISQCPRSILKQIRGLTLTRLPPPLLLPTCLFLRALYTFKTFDPFFRSSSRILTASKVKERCPPPLSLSPCELFGNRANNFPTRVYRYPAPRCLPSFLTLFLADKSRGISRPNLFVSRANIFQRLFYESLAGGDFFHHFFTHA